jgi:hypothetical protein
MTIVTQMWVKSDNNYKEKPMEQQCKPSQYKHDYMYL